MTVVDRRSHENAVVPVESPEDVRGAAGVPGLGRVGGLDGLRGVAVAVVVVFHLGRLQGGFLGVDLFFVLSGFLITSLLVGEVASTRTVGLGGFWSRRARRLLPALLVVMTVVGGLLLWLTPQADRARFRGEGLATLGYVANWQRVFSQRSYWDMFSQASPFDHMWSLAIEEQFYAAWPLVVLGVAFVVRRRGRGDAALWAGVLAGVGAAGSLIWLALSYDPFNSNFAYFSTPTRLGPVLAGSSLAALTAAARSRPVFLLTPLLAGRRRALVWTTAVAGVLGLGVIGWLVVDLNGLAARYYRGGLVLFTAACVLAVHSIVSNPGGRVGRVLSFTPLRLLEIISYGVYLWHWPVIVFLTPERAHVDGVALDVVRVVLILVAATLSYRLVELPVRHGVPVGRRLLAVGPAALAVSLGATLVATSGTPRPVFSDIPDGPLAGTDTIFLHVPATVSGGGRRVLLVGDSGAQFLGPELVDVGTEEGLSVAFSSEVACTPVVPEGLTQRPNGTVDRQRVCGDHRRALWTRLVEEFDPDIVVYYLANAGGLSRIRLDGEWLFDCDATYDDYIDRTLRSDADLLSASGATVVFTTSPYLAVLDGRSKDRTDCRNQLLRDLAASRPGTSVVELNTFVLGEARAGHDMFVDSLHLSPEGGQLVSRWLLPLIL